MEEDRRPRIEVPDLSFLPEGDDGMPASIKVSAMADVEDYVYDYLNRLHPDVAKTFAERTKRKFNEIQDPLDDVIEHYNQTKISKVHEALMRQRQTGVIPGIMGRLGDLGAIDKKYDVAISTVFGGALDILVTDTTDTATQCIMYLKQNDVGRASFMAYEKTTRWADKVRGNFQAPENAPRLVDLIRLDNEDMRTVFYHYLRDTLVANDMEQARRIAYGAQKFKVVTLKGELVELSGAMTGGGRQQSGKMGTQIQATDDTDLKTLERALRKDEEQMSKVSEKKQDLEQRLYASRKEVQERERLSKKLQMEVSSLKEEVKILEDQIATQENVVKKAKPDEAKLEEMNAEVEACMA